MKSSWPIWTAFLACLAIAVAAMVWLTRETIQLEQLRRLDRAEIELARREAELQERISSALWRMDSLLTPLISQEASRSFDVYQPFQPSPGSKFALIETKNDGTANELSLENFAPSPLLTQPNEYVLLHFQIDTAGNWNSPQVPNGQFESQATACGVMPETVRKNAATLKELQSDCQFRDILFNCPVERLPAVKLPNAPWQQSQAVEDFVNSNLSANRTVIQSTPQQAQTESTPPNRESSGQQNQLQSAGQFQKNPLVSEQRNRNAQRGNQDLDNRSKASQTYALNAFADSLLSKSGIETAAIGVMRPFWLNDHLLLARRVDISGATIVQGCWLNWDRLKTHLIAETADVIEQAELRAITAESQPHTGRILATVPVELVVDPASITAIRLSDASEKSRTNLSGSQLAIWGAWISLTLAALASAFMLGSVMRLSERRAAFVSAVSHELRSPLTTFQLYSEMLADNIASPTQQIEYAQTLKAESRRLGNLVENVLQYARLEKGRAFRTYEQLIIGDFLTAVEPRLRDRTTQTGLELAVEASPDIRAIAIKSDPEGIERVLFNLVDNACKYARTASDRRVVLAVQRCSDQLQLSVRDFGPGIVGKQRRQLFQAFCKSDQDAANTAPGVGLGLALSQRIAKSLNGQLRFEPTERGARFVLDLPIHL